jgi:Protein of unknown function (DUF3617)
MSRNVVLALGAIAAVTVPAAAATTVHAAMAMHVNPGLWEVTVTPKASGQLPVSDAELARIPADRRAKIMAAMQSIMNKPHTMKECLTEEKLSKGFVVGRENASCTSNVISNTASLMEVQTTCTAAADGLRTMDLRFQSHGSGDVMGTTHMIMTRGAKTMTVDGTMTGHWLGSDCGSVKTVKMEN